MGLALSLGICTVVQVRLPLKALMKWPEVAQTQLCTPVPWLERSIPLCRSRSKSTFTAVVKSLPQGQPLVHSNIFHHRVSLALPYMACDIRVHTSLLETGYKPITADVQPLFCKEVAQGHHRACAEASCTPLAFSLA